jgi:hypothetical protein
MHCSPPAGSHFGSANFNLCRPTWPTDTQSIREKFEPFENILEMECVWKWGLKVFKN